ncbi:MAG: TatD family hydrolase [Verrucomicrobiota bacterium]
MIDAHLHLQKPPLCKRADQIVGRLRDLGVNKVVANGTSPTDWDEVAKLAERFPEVIPSFGIHPWWTGSAERGWEKELEKWLKYFPQAGVGEVGLDRWMRNPDLPRQRELFLHQVEIARKWKRPLSIHCLRAWGHLAECLDESAYEAPFLLHSFGGPAELVDRFLEQGAYFSISGYFFRPEKRAKLDVFRFVPDHRILLETDAPDMALPEALEEFPWQGEGEKSTNDPGNLRAVYEAFAEWAGKSFEEVEKQMERNFEAWYQHPATSERVILSESIE